MGPLGREKAGPWDRGGARRRGRRPVGAREGGAVGPLGRLHVGVDLSADLGFSPGEGGLSHAPRTGRDKVATPTATGTSADTGTLTDVSCHPFGTDRDTGLPSLPLGPSGPFTTHESHRDLPREIRPVPRDWD